MISYFDEFIKEGCKWISEYRKSILKKYVIISLIFIIALGAVFGGINYIESKKMQDFEMGFFASLVLFTPMFIIILLIVNANTSPKKMKNSIKKAVMALNMDEREKEICGKEIVTALSNPSNVLDYQMVGVRNKQIYARFIITPRYACLWGDNPIVNLIRLTDVAEIHASENQDKTKVRTSQSNTTFKYTVYELLFYYKEIYRNESKPKHVPDRKMSFLSEEIRDKIFTMLQEQEYLLSDVY